MFVLQVFGGSHIAGPIRGTIGPGDYFVDSSIVLQPPDTLLILPGTRVYFQPFSGFDVHGTLLAKGTDSLPVAFSSYEDYLSRQPVGGNPAAFDWNGIRIVGDSARAHFSNVSISYSVFGISGEGDSVRIVLDSVTFFSNATAHFIVNDYLFPVTPFVPYSNNVIGHKPARNSQQNEISTTEPVKSNDKKSIAFLQDFYEKTSSWGRWTSVSAFVLGSALSVGGHYLAEKTHSEYTSARNSDNARTLREKRDRYAVFLPVGLTLSIGGIGLMTVDFLR